MQRYIEIRDAAAQPADLHPDRISRWLSDAYELSLRIQRREDDDAMGGSLTDISSPHSRALLSGVGAWAPADAKSRGAETFSKLALVGAALAT